MKFISLVFPLVLAACAAPTTPAPSPQSTYSTEVWVVASRYQDCQGAGPMKCMQITKANGETTLFYDTIEGFNYQEGSEYRIEVHGDGAANPPADGSSRRYKLVRIIAQTMN
ncbi:MAG TPA: DUF4377 domain-containing protein [Thiolinea sp.]|nr:DUF4377 domain-containing protein [Thiolinea sp.]